MKKLLFSTLIFCLLSFSTNAQEEKEVDCSDLKTGVFIIPADKFVPLSTKIVRENNFQREYMSNGDEASSRLKWLSDCSYLMLPEPEKEGEDPMEALVRKHGGVQVDLTARKGDTIYFTANLYKALKKTEVSSFMIKIE
ncbi:hypothetical protein IMCC3317_39410 [Kordia antarctica]|uniref:Uncharacterized protein n=1 Tax=Kordia antarctica TaxID=1218801 RepID=A0A7L4ZP83_9FLAO|nr:hypothetical protein [Kordia antarctica]QHI38548.1 hypothetical protein IMCC3317_39410 [Kordia antarctica]